MKNKQKRLKHINAITNQVERQAALNNKDNHKDNYKEIFEEIEELAEETNHSDLIYYLQVILPQKDLMISVMV